MVQVAEHLLSKCKALSPNLSTTKEKKKKRFQFKYRHGVTKHDDGGQRGR
jgi:hypothetical protein